MSKEASHLVPMTEEQQESEDTMLASLTTLAYSTELPNKPKAIPKSKRRSRFFFRMSKSIAEDVAEAKVKLVPPRMEHIDAEVEARLKKYKKEVASELTTNINEVREFFLKQLGPLTMATGAGSIQAREVVQRLLQTEVDSTQFEKFERMNHTAVAIKMARFIVKYYGLPRKYVPQIIEAIYPRSPRTAIIPIPTTQSEPRHERNKQERKEGKES